MSSDYYFEGDPAVTSTRRHLERVLHEPQRRRWPWLVAAFLGGALAVWRARRGSRSSTRTPA
jgi:hypothetical protein